MLYLMDAGFQEFLRWALKQQTKKRQSKRKKTDFFRTVNIFLFNSMQCRSAPLKTSRRKRVWRGYNKEGSVRCDNSVMSHANFMLLSTKIICVALKIKTHYSPLDRHRARPIQVSIWGWREMWWKMMRPINQSINQSSERTLQLTVGPYIGLDLFVLWFKTWVMMMNEFRKLNLHEWAPQYAENPKKKLFQWSEAMNSSRKAVLYIPASPAQLRINR